MNKLLLTCNHLTNNINELLHYDKFEIILPKKNKQTLNSSEMYELLKEPDIAIVGDDIVNEDSLTETNLKHLIKWGVGYDSIDINALKEKGIRFYHTPGVFSNEVADLAVGYLISIERGIHNTNEQVRRGTWQTYTGRTLAEKTAGVIGFGSIGKAISHRLQSFGIKVCFYDPYLSNFEGNEKKVDMDLLLESSDYLFLACNLTKDNFHLFNRKTFKQMKDGVVIINIARGNLINEIDLLEAMSSKKVKAVGLDVFEEEPPAIDKFDSPESLFGAHGGSSTLEAIKKINDSTMTLAFRLANGKSYDDLPVKKIL